jgi:putative membrane protein
LNLAFFVAGIVMMLVSLQLSVDASRADEERRRLVEEISILNLRIEELEAESRSHRP